MRHGERRSSSSSSRTSSLSSSRQGLSSSERHFHHWRLRHWLRRNKIWAIWLLWILVLSLLTTSTHLWANSPSAARQSTTALAPSQGTRLSGNDRDQGAATRAYTPSGPESGALGNGVASETAQAVASAPGIYQPQTHLPASPFNTHHTQLTTYSFECSAPLPSSLRESSFSTLADNFSESSQHSDSSPPSSQPFAQSAAHSDFFHFLHLRWTYWEELLVIAQMYIIITIACRIQALKSGGNLTRMAEECRYLLRCFTLKNAYMEIICGPNSLEMSFMTSIVTSYFTQASEGSWTARSLHLLILNAASFAARMAVNTNDLQDRLEADEAQMHKNPWSFAILTVFVTFNCLFHSHELDEKARRQWMRRLRLTHHESRACTTSSSVCSQVG